MNVAEPLALTSQLPSETADALAGTGRRAWLRVRSGGPVRVAINFGGFRFGSLVPIDLSLGGVSVPWQEHAPQRGTTIEVELELPGYRLLVPAVVAWTGTDRLGLAFVPGPTHELASAPLAGWLLSQVQPAPS